jgi:hypothetical protein
VHEKGRDRYLLSRCGLGCRFWVWVIQGYFGIFRSMQKLIEFSSTVIDDLESQGYISPSSICNALSVTRDLKYNYTLNKSPKVDPVIQGKFI